MSLREQVSWFPEHGSQLTAVSDLNPGNLKMFLCLDRGSGKQNFDSDFKINYMSVSPTIMSSPIYLGLPTVLDIFSKVSQNFIFVFLT